MRNRSLGFLLAACVVLSGLTSTSFALVPGLGLPVVVGFTTTSGLAQVMVSNPATVSQVCTVTVTALSGGALVTTSATQSVAAGGSATVSVPASGLPVSITVTTEIADSQNPGGEW